MSGLTLPRGSRSRRWALLVTAAGALLFLSACSQAAADRGEKRPVAAARSGSGPPVAAAADAGVWYAFESGLPVHVVSPAAAKTPFEPWTVQCRVAGFLKLGSELYVAVNGWGIAALGEPAPAPFRSFENRRLFGGRTINGFFAEKGRVLLDLYRNTVFATEAPRSTPLTFVRFDAATGAYAPVRLPPSREGWEAVDVVHARGGRWAFAWKKSTPDHTRFQYLLYDPATGAEKTIDRDAFFASYGFVDVADAPRAMRMLAHLAAARVDAPAPAATTVLHLEVRGAPYERTDRFRLGSEKLLTAGDARLIIIPVVRTAGRLYALLPKGRLLWVSSAPGDARSGVIRLPALPQAFTYTDFWTDGRLLVASWEQQRFAEVGAAGIYRLSLDAGLRVASQRRATR